MLTENMYYQSQYKHLIVRITKWHYSCNTDPSAPIFLPNMHYLMVKVWCKFEQNLKKAIKVINTLNVDGITESWSHWITDMLKTVYPTKTMFCRGYKKLDLMYFCLFDLRFYSQLSQHYEVHVECSVNLLSLLPGWKNPFVHSPCRVPHAPEWVKILNFANVNYQSYHSVKKLTYFSLDSWADLDLLSTLPVLSPLLPANVNRSTWISRRERIPSEWQQNS